MYILGYVLRILRLINVSRFEGAFKESPGAFVSLIEISCMAYTQFVKECTDSVFPFWRDKQMIVVWH